MIAKTGGIDQHLGAGAVGIAAAVAASLPPSQVNAAPASDPGRGNGPGPIAG
jgi:hypothetical protein